MGKTYSMLITLFYASLFFLSDRGFVFLTKKPKEQSADYWWEYTKSRLKKLVAYYIQKFQHTREFQNFQTKQEIKKSLQKRKTKVKN